MARAGSPMERAVARSLGYDLEATFRIPYRFEAKGSCFGAIKAFPRNVEIETSAQYFAERPPVPPPPPPPRNLADDANVPLSAVLGHAALRVFTKTDLCVLTTPGVLQEAREYLPLMAKPYDMLPQALEGQLRLLAVRECEPDEYAPKLERAQRAIARRNPHDVDLLALAMAFRAAVWSNDNDIRDVGVEWYTTARLLRRLGI